MLVNGIQKEVESFGSKLKMPIGEYTKLLVQKEQEYKELFGEEEFNDMRKRSYETKETYLEFMQKDMQDKLKQY